MKFQRVCVDEYRGWFKYVCGNVTIQKTHGKNIFTGKEMSHQVYEIFCDGKKVGFELTLKEAKETAMEYIK